MLKEAKVYVAGHTGMVGSAIVRQLKRDGYNNILLRTHEELDLTRQEQVERFFEEEKPEYVFMAAALVGGIQANFARPVEFGLQNMQMTCSVLKSSHDVGVKKLVYLGSACIYPNDVEFPVREEALLSGALEATNEAYAIAKSFGVKMCEYYYREYGRDFVAVMPANCFGENDCFDLKNSHVIPAMIRKCHEAKEQEKSEIVIWGSGMPRREFIYVDDLADACVFIMKNASGISPINIGTAEEISMIDLAKLVRKITGYSGKIVCDTSKQDGKMRNLLDTSKLMELGWKPKYSIETGIEKLYEWYLSTIK